MAPPAPLYVAELRPSAMPRPGSTLMPSQGHLSRRALVHMQGTAMRPGEAMIEAFSDAFSGTGEVTITVNNPWWSSCSMRRFNPE